MNSALICIYALLQLVLAPILYPYGYIVQAAAVALTVWHNRILQTVDIKLLEILLFAFLVTNMTFDAELNIPGYATRAGLLFLLCYNSPHLQMLSQQMMEPMISTFLLLELLASPHLYPSGYLAQLGIILFLTFYENQTKSKQHFKFHSKLRDLVSVSQPLAQSEEMLRCKICLENVVNIAFTTCGHTCCQGCFEVLLEASTEEESSHTNFVDTNNQLILYSNPSSSPSYDTTTDDADISSSSSSSSTTNVPRAPAEQVLKCPLACPFCKTINHKKIDLYFP